MQGLAQSQSEKQLIASTPTEGFRSLGQQGEAAHKSHAQLESILGERIGDRAAFFLAEPRINTQGNSIDWYVTNPGGEDVIFWGDASPEQKERMVSSTEKLLPQFGEFAEKMGDAGTAGRMISNVLIQALIVPDERHLCLVGDRTACTFWAMAPSTAEHAQSVLPNLRAKITDPTPRPKQVAVALPLQASGRGRFWAFFLGGGFFGWLLRIIFLALLAALLFWLSRGGERERMKVPEAVLRDKDIGFFEGQWWSVSDLRARNTGEPLVIVFDFGRDGRGKAVLEQKFDGSFCRGNVHASFEGERRLIFDGETLMCPDQSFYNHYRIECTINDLGFAECIGLHPGSSDRFEVILEH